MPRFRLLIEYAGTRYSGWQIQKNARTVQGEIDRAIREVSRRQDFELYGSGRTDAGVHALAQVAHLELYTSIAPEPLRRQINDELPADPEAWFAAAQHHDGSWWADWAQWNASYAGELVPAREPGAGKLPVLEDAPGSYVKSKA